MPRSRRYHPLPPDSAGRPQPGSAAEPVDPERAQGAAAPAPGGRTEEHSLSHLDVPAETTPTWELEMLVSGAVLFGLLQLPPILSDALTRLAPRLGGRAFLLTFEAYMLVKAMLYALIAGFLLHLASRAYWVALVGLDSVFPRGIRWERAGVGPVTRDVLRARLVPLPVRIERIDNFASVIFAGAFGVVFILLGGLVLVAVLAALAWIVTHALRRDGAFSYVFSGLVAVLLIAPLVAYALDRRLGDRLARESGRARFIRAVVLFNYRLQGMAIHGPITQTLVTNVRKRIAWPAMMLLIVGAVAAGMVDVLISRNVLRLDGLGTLPLSGAGVLNYRYYADQRTGDDRFSGAPFIQSDVLRDPYVRLFVPYVPARDDPGVMNECPAARALGSVGAGSESARLNSSLLACLGRLRAVSLDGRPVDPDFRFSTDPQSGLRGLLGYVSVDGLGKGRHVLLVLPPPLAPDAPRKDSLRAHADSIPFRL